MVELGKIAYVGNEAVIMFDSVGVNVSIGTRVHPSIVVPLDKIQNSKCFSLIFCIRHIRCWTFRKGSDATIGNIL